MEFLGRDHARDEDEGEERAMQLAPLSFTLAARLVATNVLGNGTPVEPPYVFGAAGRTSDNRNYRTSRRH